MTQQTPNPFVLGSFVVAVNTHWRRRIGSKAQIVKVTPGGLFWIQYAHNTGPTDKKFRPQRISWSSVRVSWSSVRESWRAEEVGGSKYSHSHLEPWSDEIEAEIANDKKTRDAHALRQAFIKKLEGFTLDTQENRDALGRMIMAGGSQ